MGLYTALVDHFSRDPLIEYMKNPNFRVDPIVQFANRPWTERKRININLNLIRLGMFWELMFAVTDLQAIHGTNLEFSSFCLRALVYMVALQGWINAQKDARALWFSPCIVKITYYSIICLVQVVFLVTSCDDASDECHRFKEVCLFIAQFPLNLQGTEGRKLRIPEGTAWTVWLIIAIVYQLAQLFMVVQSWRYFSSLRREALLLPTHETARTVSPLDQDVQPCDPVPSYESVTIDLPPIYEQVTASDQLPNYEAVTADDVPPDYDAAVSRMPNEEVTTEVPEQVKEDK